MVGVGMDNSLALFIILIVIIIILDENGNKFK